MLDRLAGANIVLVAPTSYEGKVTELGYVAGLKDKMNTYADKLRYKLPNYYVGLKQKPIIFLSDYVLVKGS